MTIATIIVNYNAGAMLQRCVNAVLESTEQTTVTVIDNASSDGSAENLLKTYADHDRVEIQFNSNNVGFAPAINAAARRSVSNWVLILNPDCILEPETLGRLKNALENDAKAGLAGPAVRDVNGKINVRLCGVFRIPGDLLLQQVVFGVSVSGFRYFMV